MDQAAAVAFRANQLAAAEADARQALALGQDSGIAQEILAASLDAQGKDQEALQAYKAIADMGGQFPRNLLPYALLLLKTGRCPEAVAIYDRALPFLPGDHTGSTPPVAVQFSQDTPDANSLAAAIHVALGLDDNFTCDWTGNALHQRALEEYTKALQLRPDWDVANFYYGYGLQRLGLKQQANIAFQKTVKMAKGEVKAAAEAALKKQKKSA